MSIDDKIIGAIKGFDWSNYGLDEVEDLMDTDAPHVPWHPHVDHRGLIDFAFTPDTVVPAGRPWDEVEPVQHCPACRGALPANVDGACEECGSGTAVLPADVRAARNLGDHLRADGPHEVTHG